MSRSVLPAIAVAAPVAASLFLAPADASAGVFTGATVRAQFIYNNALTPGGPLDTPKDLTPGTSVSYSPASSVGYVLSMTEEGLSVQLNMFGGLADGATYAGIYFEDVNNALPDFTTLTPTLAPTSDLAGFTTSRVYLFENAMVFHLGGLQRNGALDTAAVNFTVPEPAAATALAVLAAPAMLRRRKA